MAFDSTFKVEFVTNVSTLFPYNACLFTHTTPFHGVPMLLARDPGCPLRGLFEAIL
ncbi:hypothetical protein AGMMS49545_06510 [Betaproteobacteria bacterium]|nr:hypothetical protein AGMMS49545_06510 [Betaproteobacteria bacterium]GHU14148.1 hypothetical protein FACS189441_3150 [Betaproteobacteria bacterium]GHU45076.1 hypothetical protein AGMMS50289_15320 [Betaproteobacteria bacterium]